MKKGKILANCIEEIRSGKSTIEDCTTRYPHLGKELSALLEISSFLKPDDVVPSAEFKQRTKMRLFAEMRPAPAKAPHSWWKWQELGPFRVLALVLIGILILGVAGGSTIYAAQSSLPGDMLYPVKTGVENFQLAVTTSAAAKADLHIKLAERRIDEVTQQVKLNHDITTQALDDIQQQYNDALKELSNSGNTKARNDTLSHLSEVTLNQQVELEQVISNASQNSQPLLQQIIDETRRGNTIAQVAYANHDFLQYQPSVADQKLDAGQFSIDGNLLSIQDKTWNVGGTIIENVHLSGKIPAIGRRVKLQGLVKDNHAFISKIEVSENSPELTKVEGRYSGTSQNGTAFISGIPVTLSDNSSTQLTAGDKVQLQGGANDDELDVTDKQNDGNDNSTLSGVLTVVDTAKGTIIVEMTGKQFAINVSKARIEGKNGSHWTLELSDLKNLIGQDIKLEGLSKKNNLLYASRVQAEID